MFPMYFKQFANGTAFSFGHPRSIKIRWKKNPETFYAFYSCFDIYWEKWTEDKFYFFFPVMPVCVEKIVEEFNSKFQNIKIEIIKNKDIYGTEEIDTFGFKLLKLSETSGDMLIGKCPLFSISFNENYPGEIAKYVQYVIHHFLRMFSLSEGFFKTGECPEKDFIDFICDVNNGLSDPYRALSIFPITEEDFLLLDSIEIAEILVCKGNRLRKQTSVFELFKNRGNFLAHDKNGELLSIGDLVKGWQFSRGIINENLKMGRITDIKNDNFVVVEILKHTFNWCKSEFVSTGPANLIKI